MKRLHLITQGLLKLLLCLVIAVSLIVGAVALSIYSFAGESQLVSADAAIVLGAGTFNGQPSPVFRERINHALELYRAGYVHKIIFTGGPDYRGARPEASAAQQYALALGIPQSDILIETQSQTTEENLSFAQQLGANNHLTRFLIVSDPLHMKRAMQIAHDLNMDAYSSPTPTTRYTSLPSQLAFTARETYNYLSYLLRRSFHGA